MERLIICLLTRLGLGVERRCVTADFVARNIANYLGENYSAKAIENENEDGAFGIKITDLSDGWEGTLVYKYRLNAKNEKIITSIMFD